MLRRNGNFLVVLSVFIKEEFKVMMTLSAILDAIKNGSAIVLPDLHIFPSDLPLFLHLPLNSGRLDII